MKNYDSHLHLGDYNKSIHIIKKSQYRNKYKLYSAIEPKVILTEDEYINKLDAFFAIPLFFKESNIEECNNYVEAYCNRTNKGIPVFIINDNMFFKHNYYIALFKEHFLLNNFENWKNRSLYYEYLSNNEGFLLLHSKDNIRIEYIKLLLENFPKMNIIIAHLGRDTYETQNFINAVLDTFKNNNRIYFDISTIHYLDNIKNAINKVGSERLLFGSDFPFEILNYDIIFKYKEILANILSIEESENIFEKNFEGIRKRTYVKK